MDRCHSSWIARGCLCGCVSLLLVLLSAPGEVLSATVPVTGSGLPAGTENRAGLVRLPVTSPGSPTVQAVPSAVLPTGIRGSLPDLQLQDGAAGTGSPPGPAGPAGNRLMLLLLLLLAGVFGLLIEMATTRRQD